jgi:formamidopyrimidine-DNA glycosylase
MTLAEVLAAIKKQKAEIRKWRERKLENRRVKRWHLRWRAAGKCRQCGKPCEIRPKTGKPFGYCAACRAKVKARNQIS